MAHPPPGIEQLDSFARLAHRPKRAGLYTVCVRVIAFLLPATFLIGSGAEASETSSYSVGFRVTREADRTRSTAVRAEGRPVQISVWYPAASGGAALAFRDYVA